MCLAPAPEFQRSLQDIRKPLLANRFGNGLSKPEGQCRLRDWVVETVLRSVLPTPEIR